MTEPKVSERMRLLAEAFRTAGNCSFCNMDSGECRCGWERTAAKTDIHTKREALLSAIAEIEAERDRLKAELSTLRERISSRADFLIQALNEGDGVYRP